MRLASFCRRSQQGGIVPLKIGLTRGHLVSEPALIRHVLLENASNHDKHTPAYDAVQFVLGNGMFTSSGSFWKRQRRIASPAFHGERVKRFAPILVRLTNECADTWQEAAEVGQPARLSHHPRQPGDSGVFASATAAVDAYKNNRKLRLALAALNAIVEQLIHRHETSANR